MPECDLTVLSTRERQLLKFAASGFTDTAISHRLGISEATVKTYWRRTRDKIGHFSRPELVAIVLRSEMGRAVAALREETLKLRTEPDVKADYYRQLIDEAPDAILVVTREGTILELNKSAVTLFGWEQDELRGQHVSLLLPERHRSAHAQHILDFLETPSKREMGEHLATSAIDRAGDEFTIAASLASVGEGEDMTVICIVRSLRWK